MQKQLKVKLKAIRLNYDSILREYFRHPVNQQRNLNEIKGDIEKNDSYKQILKNNTIGKKRLTILLQSLVCKKHPVNKHSKHNATNDPSIVVDREGNFVAHLLYSLSLKKVIVFIDKMTFNNKIHPEYLRATTAYDIIMDRSSKKTAYSVIGASTSDQVVLFRIFDTSINSESFGSFLVALLDYYSNKKVIPDNLVIILDNAPTHRARRVTALEFFTHFLWLAPYAPHLNFVERIFAVWKAQVEKKTYASQSSNLPDISLEALSPVTTDSWLKKQIEQLDRTSVLSEDVDP
jgi:transposase